MKEKKNRRYKTMRKGHNTFKAWKILTQGMLIALYFLASAQVMREIWKERYLPVTLLYMVMLEVSYLMLEAGNIEQRRILDLVYGQFFGALCANLFFALLMYTVSTLSFEAILPYFFTLTLLEVMSGILWAVLFFWIYLKGQSFKKALFIYGNRERMPETVLENNRINGYFQITKSMHFREGIPKAMKLMEDCEAVFLGDIPCQERNELMKTAVRMDRECYSIPKVTDIYIKNTTIRRLYDKVLFRCSQSRLTREQEVIKRAEDVIVSFLLLVPALPVMLLIALGIKLEDRGPVFYRQKRVTKGGREFDMLKFRSMHVDAEKDGPRLAGKYDSRITKVGRVIRNLHFDELPQLFNIFRGEMSLVGPRPERREFIEEYAKIIPEFTERLKVRGGLTGYAQIYGKYNTGPEDKIKYDLIYIYQYSLRLDIRLLFLTVRILFQKENAEGVEEKEQDDTGDQKGDGHGKH